MSSSFEGVAPNSHQVSQQVSPQTARKTFPGRLSVSRLRPFQSTSSTVHDIQVQKANVLPLPKKLNVKSFNTDPLKVLSKQSKELEDAAIKLEKRHKAKANPGRELKKFRLVSVKPLRNPEPDLGQAPAYVDTRMENEKIKGGTLYRIAHNTLEALGYAFPAVTFVLRNDLFAKQIASIPSFGVDVAVATSDLYTASKNVGRHRRWMQKINPFSPHLHQAETKAKFKNWMHDLLNSPPEQFPEVVEKMANWGIDLNSMKEGKEITSLEELKTQFQKKRFEHKLYRKYFVKAKSVAKANAMLDRRKELFNTLLKTKETEFLDWVDSSLEGTFEEAKAALKDKGISLDSIKGGEEIKTLEELKSKLADPEFKKTLLEPVVKQFAQHVETISTTIENTLMDLIRKKQNMEGLFINFKFRKAEIYFGTAALTAIVGITLNALLIAGVITLPFMVMSIPGAVAVVCLASLTALGFYLLYKNKPHSFKEMVKGVNARLITSRLILATHSWNLKRTRANQQRKAVAIRFLRAKMEELQGLDTIRQNININDLPKALKPLAEKITYRIQHGMTGVEKDELNKEVLEQWVKYDEEAKKLSGKAIVLQDKIGKWERTTRHLRKRLVTAGWKDFSAKHKIFQGKEPGEGDILDKIAGVIVEYKESLSDETHRLMETQMEIDSRKELTSRRKTRKYERTEKLAKGMRSFFAKDDVQMAKLVNRRLKNKPLPKHRS